MYCVPALPIPGPPGPAGAPGPVGPRGLSGPPGPSALGIDINSLTSSPLIPDGVTQNYPQLHSLGPVLQSVGPEFPVPVIITVGSPTTVMINRTLATGGNYGSQDATHGFKPNQCFYFPVSPGVSLPAGITPGTLYYVMAANMTATTFTFSTVNNWGFTGSTYTQEGPAVNTTGSVTGQASIVLTGRDLNIFIPPGPYFTGIYADPNPNIDVTPNGISRIRYFAYGAMFDTKVSFGSQAFLNDAKTWASQVYDFINTPAFSNYPANLDAQLVIQTTANAANYYIGQWIAILGLDLQNAYNHFQSGPPNNAYFEFKQIKAINLATGTLTVDGPLKWAYLSTFPNLTNYAGHIGGGQALIAQMHPNWDMEVEVHGARWYAQPGGTVTRRVVFQDCVWQGFGFQAGVGTPPTVSKSWIFRNCRFLTPFNQGTPEIDKMLEYLEFDGCSGPHGYTISFVNSTLHDCRIRNHIGTGLNGTPRSIGISDSILDALTVGPETFGLTSVCEVHNSRIIAFDMKGRDDDPPFMSPNNDMTLLANWSFSGGTFTRNISAPSLYPMTWQMPGAKLYLVDASATYQYWQNMGSPFAILNTYMDGSGNFSFDTTLTAIPTRQTSAAVTLTIASPGVVNWTAHGLAAGTPIVLTVSSGGAFPTGLSRSTIFWVTAPTANAFNVAATSGGAAIAFTGTQSGTFTAYANPLAFRPHPCPRFTGFGNSGSGNLIDLNGAVDEPLFSRVRRSFVGKLYNAANFAQYFPPQPRIWGNLISMTVTVVRAYVSGTLNINCPGFTQPNLGLSTFNQTIDLTQAGRRVVTSTTVTGNLGVDALVAYADWVAGPLQFATAGCPATLTGSGVVLFEMLTDQGITRFGNMAGAPAVPAANSFVWTYSDASIQAQYGSLP